MYTGSRQGAPTCYGCGWCVGTDEAAGFAARARCGKFKRLKAGLTARPYLELELKPAEKEGFAAAGVLLFRRGRDGVDVLLAREWRGDKGDRLNFLGGKRRVKATTATEVAVAKLYAETGGQLLPATMRAVRDHGFHMVHWGARSKYVLFLHELCAEGDMELDVRCAGVTGAKRLEWVPRAQLRNATFVRAELHEFAAEMLRDVQDCRVLDQLEALFDCAGRAAGADSGADAAAESVPVVATHAATFDVLEALRACAVAARPDDVPLPVRPDWRHLLDLTTQLHKTDIKKLRLRFHPDSLQRMLGRAPTEKEGTMATNAMQVLNLLFAETADAASSSGTGMAMLAELDGLRCPAAQSAHASNDDDDLAAMLARVRVSPSCYEHLRTRDKSESRPKTKSEKKGPQSEM